MALRLFFGEFPAVFDGRPLYAGGFSTTSIFGTKANLMNEKIEAHLLEVPSSKLGDVRDYMKTVSNELIVIHGACRDGDFEINVVPVLISLTTGIKLLGDYSILVEDQLAKLHMDLDALKKNVIELQMDFDALKKKLSELEKRSTSQEGVTRALQLQTDSYQYRDWVTALFDVVGLSDSLEGLRAERRYNKYPLHWSRKRHLSLLERLRIFDITSDSFDILWNIKEKSNCWAHGHRVVFISMDNYQEEYAKDVQELDAKLFTGEEKLAIKMAMDTVKRDFEAWSRVVGAGGGAVHGGPGRYFTGS